MKTRSKLMSRLLSLALCLCMVLALLPAIPLVAQAATASVIYLKPNVWNTDGARYAAYFFGNGETWVNMTDLDGNGILECAVPSGFTSVIFCRMTPNSTNTWSNSWNQSYDLTVPTTNKILYSITSWGSDKTCPGTWNAPSCQEVGHSFVNDVCTRCSAPGRTIYFQNNWLWGDVRVHYYKGSVNNGWPGQAMDFYGKAPGLDVDELEHFKLTIPADIDGFIINGNKDGARPETKVLSISDWSEGFAYYLVDEEGIKAKQFELCKAFENLHTLETVSGYPATCTVDGLSDGQKCSFCNTVTTAQQPVGALGHSFDETGVCSDCGTGTMKIFFQNNWMWENISLYYWFDGTTLDNTWPGDLMDHYGKATVDFEGGAREFDYYVLTVPANVAGIIINGVDPSKPEGKQNRQTFEIPAAQLQNGVTFHINGEEAEAEGRDQWCYVDSFSITKDFPCALGHAEVQHEAQAVTCTEIGWNAYVTCENCDYSTYEEIPAPGHTEVTVPGYAETCDAPGMTDGTKCSVCGETLTAQEEISATGNHVDVSKEDGRCDVCRTPMQDVYLGYITASLEGNIAVNYFMLLSDAVLADESAYMQFTMADGDIIKVPVKDSKLIDGYDVFTCEVAAKEMTDIITSQFYYGGEPAFEKDHPYNIRDYAEHILKQNGDAKTQDLMKAMVNYGAASQVHFGHHTNELANSILETKPDYSNMAISGYDVIRGQGTDNVKFYSATLILNSETTLRFFFNGNVTNATYEGQDLPVKYRGGLYYVDVVDIAAKDLDEDVTITINDGAQTADITFNPISYCQLILNDDSGTYTDELRELVYALYLYNQAASAYFVNDGPQGTTLSNALHNLNGNGGVITSQVTSVTFGRSNAYRDIANTYEGTLVDVDQDAPAYAYYVNNGSGYDVYVLSNDVVYAPKDSTKLFGNMSSLTSVKTDNFDVSRVTNAYQMFIRCSALEEIDVSDWDTSNITDMTAIFYMCQSLKTIPGIKNWDTSSCTTLYCAFYKMLALESLDLSGWDVRKVTDLRMAFLGNTNMRSLNIAGWNIASACDATSMLAGNVNLEEVNATGMKTTGITNSSKMFQECNVLNTIVGHDSWTFPNVKNAIWMFENCRALESLNVSSWGLGSLEQATGMLSGCSALEKLDGSGNWNLSKVKDVSFMFQNAKSLTYVDATEWNMGNCTNAVSMFSWCHALETVKGTEKWNVSNVTDMTAMFNENRKLNDLDVSNWDTSMVTSMNHMFFECFDLAELDVSNWNVGKVKDFAYMFKGAGNEDRMAITKLDVSEWDTSSAENMECMFQGCGKITKLDVSNWNMQNVKCVSHMFADCYALNNLNLSSWQTPSMVYMDAAFNHCSALTTINVSSFDTSNVQEFSQMFESCYLLEEIEGLEKWDTSNGLCFTEMFSGCRALTELNLSSFNTRSANENFNYHYNLPVPDDYECFQDMFFGLNSLTRLTVSADFNYDAAKVTKDNYKPRFPAPAAKEGFTAKWRDVKSGKTFLASEIPVGVAATYEAYYEPIPAV